MGDLLTPQPTQPLATGAPGASLIGPPPSMMQPQKRGTAGKLLKADLDSSLASLAENLSISKGQDNVKK